MRVDVVSIKNKYLRWVVATLAVLTIVPLAVSLMIIEPVIRELIRAYSNLSIVSKIKDSLSKVPIVVKMIYSGKKVVL